MEQAGVMREVRLCFLGSIDSQYKEKPKNKLKKNTIHM